MTHTPPVPAGNQSPYPLQEPPHPQRDAAIAPASDDHPPQLSRGAIGALAAVGAVALAAAGLWAFGTRPKRKRGKGKRGKGKR